VLNTIIFCYDFGDALFFTGYNILDGNHIMSWHGYIRDGGYAGRGFPKGLIQSNTN